MKKYIEKKISDYPLIQGFSQIESIILSENGFKDYKQIQDNFPDLFKKSWLIKFISFELSTVGRSKEFAKFISENKNKKYCIIGDYDADGIMATTIMKLALDTYGVKECNYIIPDRLNDGYGIKQKHVDRAIEMGTEVIVTVDNGVTAKEVVDYAKSKGLSVLITDHHIPDKNNLPNADLIVNPHLTEEKFEPICGAMVAFKLANELLDIKNNKEHEYILKDCSLFAAVATISDVMPMIGENRELVKYVLDNVNYHKDRNIWAGRTLKFLSGFGVAKYLMKDPETSITEDTFGFYIGPTINASGRVNGETESIIKSIIEAGEYGKFIEGYRDINFERQTKTREIFKEHVASPDPIGFLVIDHTKYSYPIGGLIGLVANRIADKEQKPAFVGTEKDGKLSFSCRSIPGYSLYEGLQRYFEKNKVTTVEGGGHDGAIGIRLSNREEIPVLKEHFENDFKLNSKIVEENVFTYEDKYSQEIFDAHYALAPFGQGFNKIEFNYKGTVTGYSTETKELFVDDKSFKTYIFADDLPKAGQKVSIIFTPQTDSNVYNSFKIEDIEIIGE
jgi:single-stranded-DNA-specific exonuclease